MPKRRNYKKRKSKLTKFSKPKTLSIGPYFPPKIICKHKFQQVYSLAQSYSDSAGQFTADEMNNFRLNSMFDPDLKVGAGSGSQPRLFDEMSSLYDTYRVLGAVAYVKFINLSAEPVYIATKVGQKQFSDGGSVSLNDWREAKDTQVNILHGVNSGPRSVRTHVRKYSPCITEGISKSEFNGRFESFSALNTQNPLIQHYLSTGMTQVSSTLGGAVNTNVQVEITIHYTSEWSGVKSVLTQS
jgi:hypothetical protein